MYRRVCVLAAVLVLALVSLGWACPRTCNCYQANEVHCTFRSLLAIPPGLPAHTLRINLGFNSISRIPDKSLAGLKRAELLMLHGNDFHQLPDGAFQDMKSLQILKLSYNKLKEISSSLTFAGLTSLLRLHLDHNLLQYINPKALLQLPSLRLLRLQGNRLHQLHPHSLCTLSLLNTYYYSTLRHLDLSNNSLTTLPRETLVTAPLLETLVLQSNPWSCDCRMNWFLHWSLAHSGLMKCSRGPQCPVCTSPISLQGQGLHQQSELTCVAPIISSPGRDPPSEADLSEIQATESFREPLGTALLGLSDEQGHNVNLNCNVSRPTNSPDVSPHPDLSLSSSSPLSLALSLSLDCPVERESYEGLWRILAYYSETAVHLEREIMLGKAPALAYRYRQTAETEGYYYTGVRASVKAQPHWLLQPAVSIQLNRAQSSRNRVQLLLSTRVSTHPDPIAHTSSSSSSSSSRSPQPWVLITTNNTATSLAAVAGSRIELPCHVLNSGNRMVQWVLPDGSKLMSPSSTPDGRLRALASGLLVQKLELSDAGLYHCVARAGRDADVLALRLAVEESSAPPSGEQVGPSVTGMVGEAVRLPCEASGSPTPDISWVLPDGSIIRQGLAVSGGLTIQPNGSLSLSNPSLNDAGQYRCMAVNQYGADSFSMQLHLNFNPRHTPPVRTSFPKGPQPAAGRSTRIRAPLLRQSFLEEGSGDEEEEEERIPTGNKRRPRPPPPLNRRYPIGHPRRRGPGRMGPLRRGGGALSPTEQRRNRFDNRHRISPTKQRIDPQKWADLLAKIRQRTAVNNSSQPISAGEPTTEPTGREEEETDTKRERVEGESDLGRGGGEGASAGEKGTAEVETEGSSIDDTSLQEEGLHPVHTIHSETREITTDTKTGTEIEKGTESSPQYDYDCHHYCRNDCSSINRCSSNHEERPSLGQVDPRGRPVSGVPSQSRPLPDWRNPGANSIPDSHSSRPRLSSAPSLPASPGNSAGRPDQTNPLAPPQVPVVRSRPRIADPHIRTVSVPAESTARLTCETQGEPKPSITWTKVSTGAVMSVNSRSQRFEVLPNGTFVIQNVQLQDRGTYICSAHSYLGRDRMLTTLEVWSRPPRMKLANYREATIHQGGEVRLDCQADGVPTPLLSWVLPDRTVVTSTNPSHSRITMLTNGTLYISATIPSDRGMYRCVASNSAGAASASVRVHVSSLPPMIQQQREEHLILTAGMPVYAHCSARGAPTPTLRWRIPDGTLVRPSQFLHGNLFVLPNGTLHIQKLGPKDSGSYECMASNAVGADKRTVRVEVKEGARIVSTSASITTVQYGSGLMLHCSVSGNPPPTIIWRTPNRKLVDMHFSFDQRLKVHPNGSLSLHAVTEKDAGDYLCIARNKVADDYRLIRVSVATKPAKIEPKQPSNHMVSLGGLLKVDCLASGLPDPAVRWSLPDGTMVNSVLQGEDRGGRARRLTVFDNGTLLVPAVGIGEEGEYTCYAENQGGQDSMKVKVKVMMTSPPTFTDNPTYDIIRVRQGATATIRCRATGDPAPAVTWLSPNNRVIPRRSGSGYFTERIVMVSDGTLEVRLAQRGDSGNYTCRASSSAGESRRVVGLEVEVPNHGLNSWVGASGINVGVNGRGRVASHGPVSGNGLAGTSNNEVSKGRTSSDGNNGVVNSRTSGTYSDTGLSSVSNDGGGTSILRGDEFTRNTNTGVISSATILKSRNNGNNNNSTNTVIGKVPPVKQPVVKGQTVLLPCPSHGSPPPRLAWLLPGNGILPAPYYGSRLTVHRNGSLELRGVRASDAGIFVCVVKSEREETRIQVELVVSETQEEAKTPYRGPAVERPAPKNPVSFGAAHLEPDSVRSLNPPPVLPERVLPRILVTEKPLQRGSFLPAAQRPAGAVPEPVVSTKTASLVSIINGETLRLPCPASQSPGYTRSSLSWTLPSGKVLSQGESGDSGRYSVLGDGMLIVQQASVFDRGSYSCRSANHNSSSVSVLTVPVIVIAYPPRITTGPSPVTYTHPGVAVELPCLTIATPRATVTWETPDLSQLRVTGQPRIYGNRYLSAQGSLVIQNPTSRDTGFYRCTAKNVIGTDTKATYLHVI
ncbi:matrix-remodeling-associated protein 5-like [Myripristis murdjan]|uniref:matrix-remodeling-associated protein 5-like n=1 Tax=Myripristis murdjan TaxID=586833 RepID=UPI0011762858|nr:matrix-remodeling-associated protein 5-like [Myripristis murdjan]